MDGPLIADAAHLLLDAVEDMLERSGRIGQRNPVRLRKRARRARARGKTERAAELRQAAWDIEEELGLPHPGVS